MDSRFTYRNKVIVVPYARLQGNNHAKILLFRDTASGDWTFVTGGCKLKEDHYESARRELLEESRNTLHLSSMQNMFTFSFHSTYRPPAHAATDTKKVITRYTVYVVKMPIDTQADMDKYEKKYRESKVGKKKAFHETNDVAFVTLNDLLTKKYILWSFMKDEVVPKVVSLFQSRRIV